MTLTHFAYETGFFGHEHFCRCLYLCDRCTVVYFARLRSQPSRPEVWSVWRFSSRHNLVQRDECGFRDRFSRDDTSLRLSFPRAKFPASCFIRVGVCSGAFCGCVVGWFRISLIHIPCDHSQRRRASADGAVLCRCVHRYRTGILRSDVPPTVSFTGRRLFLRRGHRYLMTL